MPNIIYEEDGKLVKNNENIRFEANDIRYSISNGGYVYNFVGFIVDNNNLLAVFPKHFFDSNKKEVENNKDITLLFKVINKYIVECKSNAKASKYVGRENETEYISDYPFAAFYKVYDYYQKYGIYKKEEFEFKKNTNGKVIWKKTIQNSNKIVSNGNIIFIPLIYKKNNFKDDFISECMIFVINNTIKNFSYFLPFRTINQKNNNFDFIRNKKYVIEQLMQEKNRVFKNHQISLINALIEFFEQFNMNPRGGALHFKIKYFDRVWENMVEKYLNDYFLDVNRENNLIFDYSRKQKKKRFIAQKEFYIDDSKNNFKIIPDHYYETENKIYVFDSKYYNKLNELNYKQLVYTILIGNSIYGRNKNLYSALLLPGRERVQLHIDLTSDFKQMNDGCNKVIEQYLSVKELMQNYLNIQIDNKENIADGNDSDNEEYDLTN